MNPKNLLRLVAALTFTILAACGGDSDEGGDECLAGTEDCPCGPAMSCFGDFLTCIDDLCQEPECFLGEGGCACDADGSCSSDPNGRPLVCEEAVCVVAPCDEGSANCDCASDGSCGDGLVCDEAAGFPRCVVPDCADGGEGCACRVDGGCDGGLGCDAGICVAQSCTVGTEGCACGAELACDDGLACVDDVCELDDVCTPGTIGCACESGACADADAFCNAEDVCVSSTNAGYEGGPCIEGRCEYGYRCASGDVCTACVPGTTDCGCEPGDVCTVAGLMCVGGLCVPESEAQAPAPEDPTCYTPCEYSLVTDEGIRIQCDPTTGLMEGCWGGATEGDVGEAFTLSCVDGSCTDNGVAPTCETDLDCPQWQTCYADEGLCKSNCETTEDCPTGLNCHRYVCRYSCSSDDPCPSGMFCDKPDGEFGYCMALVPTEPSDETPAAEVNASFTLSVRALSFTNTTPESSFVIHNESDENQRFLVRKYEHEVHFDSGEPQSYFDPDDGVACDAPRCASDGDCETGSCHRDFCSESCTRDNPECAEGYFCELVDGDNGLCTPRVRPEGCPLYWMSFGPAGELSNAQEFEVVVPAYGSVTVELDVAGAAPEDGAEAPLNRWTGAVEVVNPSLGSSKVALSYSVTPEGQWQGRAIYFNDFNDAGLETWLALGDTERNDRIDVADDVQNALLRRWFATRRGDLPWEEFLEVLNATSTESWRNAAVDADCQEEEGFEACYPCSSSRSGLCEFVPRQDIPTGIFELPFAVNLRPDPEDPTAYSGRIESSVALHYAGFPEVVLDFTHDPAVGSSSWGDTSMTRLARFDAEVAVGGRHEGDPDCDATDFTLVEVPWLVPGFERNTTVDADTGALIRPDCRDRSIPFGGDGAEGDNLSLSLSNPVPDGRSRRRTIELVDGALVNEQYLMLIFRETIESFLGDSDEDGFRTYGALFLQRRDAGLDEEDYVGWTPEPLAVQPEGLLTPTCSEDLLEEAVGESELTADNVADVLWTLLTGSAVEATDDDILWPTDDCRSGDCWEQVHYLCHETGHFDGGPGNRSESGSSVGIPHDNTCGRTDLDVSGPYNGFAGNCSCDDGGPGSDTSLCPLGTDRNDCSADVRPCYDSSDVSGLEVELTDAQQNCTCRLEEFEPPVTGRRTAEDGDLYVDCPAGSDVTFFTVDSSALSQEDVAELGCQFNDPPNCGETLDAWLAGGDSPLVQVDPFWRCAVIEDGPSAGVRPVFCDAERHDLRAGKEFYSVYAEDPVFQPIETEIDHGFRYRTQFTNREGGGIGFAPQICEEGTEGLTPYCYDPWSIERSRERVDCLLAIWEQYVSREEGDGRELRRADEDALVDFLRMNTSADEPPSGDGLPDPFAVDGFERLYAELLIMLADEARTSAASSRFDLAASRSVSFPGDVFEPDGVSLSGSLGFEMYSLYQATQYYQEAIDRFYSLSPLIWQSVSPDADPTVSLVSPRTATRYIDRIVHASSQRTRAWAEIAERYAALNRSDLATRVVDRAYTAAYLESGVLARLMLRIETSASVSERDQVRAAFDEAQTRYRAGLADMQRVRAEVARTDTVYGLPPDFIPFPALDDYRALNAFEIIFQRADQKTRVAHEREDLAISSNREFDTNAEEFQSELVRIRNTYETQLLELCGSFEGDDGRIYPAIAKYAGLSDATRQLGDPCGFVGTGQIFEATGAIEDALLNADVVARRFDEIQEEIAIEQSRIEAQCRLIYATADFVFQQGEEERNLQEEINDMEVSLDALSRASQYTQTLVTLNNCSTTDGSCFLSTLAGQMLAAYWLATEATNVGLNVAIRDNQEEIQQLQIETARWNTQGDCDTITIDGNASMARQVVQIKELEIEALRAQLAIELAVSELQELRNRAQRVQEEQAESEQLLVNVTAARNNPNVRLYRNDAVINAEFSFDDAMREAYAATRAFEYYTSQTYADRESFYLIRMISRGEYNLENYLVNLQNAFFEFEDAFRAPDTRVMVLSLKDDILRIPELDDRGLALSEADRDALFTDEVTDLSRLDQDGYLTFPFSTSLDDVSPLTNNHKVLRFEVDLIGTRLGDHVGRVYVRQVGTGWIRGIDGSNTAYRFPEQLAVINTTFQGARFFEDAAVYQNFRLRDRPLVNTAWDLVLNLRDESVNQDIDLTGLDDIRIIIYYSDFTNLP